MLQPVAVNQNSLSQRETSAWCSAFLPVSVAFSHNVIVTLVCEPEAACATDKHAGSQSGGTGGRGRGHHSIENFHQFVLTTELILLCAQVNGDHTDPHGGPIYALEKKTPSLSGIADIYNKRRNRRQCTGNRKCLTGEVSWPYKMSGCLAALLPFGQADDVWTVTWFKAKLVFITPVTSH